MKPRQIFGNIHTYRIIFNRYHPDPRAVRKKPQLLQAFRLLKRARRQGRQAKQIVSSVGVKAQMFYRSRLKFLPMFPEGFGGDP